ncbi:winged helix-turn-helix domain-containing protein [Rhizobium sp. RAF36]|uniref:ATP-binding protein n=1 Tax=Rhizobium sp. RAF36 TaxID=3233055 RepID=UPI003F9473CA
MHYTFGGFELYPERRLLRHSGTAVRLGPRAFDLLVALAEHGGDVVPQAELMKRAWPHASVDEVALRVHLSSLRKALRTESPDHSPISNVSGRGYQLAFPVHRTEAASPRSAVLDADDRPSPQQSGKRLIGRDEVVAMLPGKLRETRFLSIVGPGGMGKTSVAQQVVERTLAVYPDGQVWVDLTTISDPSLVWSAIANAMRLDTRTDDLAPAVIAALRGRRFLMVLDNCEHVVETAAAAAERLWHDLPMLDILTTSREPLRSTGEWVHRLEPLGIPAEGADLAGQDIRAFPAIRLLVERATANSDSFTLGDGELGIAADLCRRLDGMPLAIELVASSIEAFGLRHLAARFDDRFFSLLRGKRTAMPRHQTLNAVLDWSYENLPDTEKNVFMRLGVFPAGIDLHHIVAVTTDDDVDGTQVMDAVFGLHEKSLLSSDLDGAEIEYRLLETTRIYALDKLRRSGDYDRVAGRYAEVVAVSLANAEPDWDTLSQPEFVNRYGPRVADLRRALALMAPDPSQAMQRAKLLTDTSPIWFELGLSAEYRNRLQALLEETSGGADLPPGLRIRVKLAWAQHTWFVSGASPKMLEAAEEALELAEQLDNPVRQMQALWLLWDWRNIYGGEEYAVADKFRRLLDTSSDPVIQLAALRGLSISLHYLGDQKAAWDCQDRMNRYSDATFRSIRKIAHRGDQKLAHITLRVRMLWLRGFPDQALSEAEAGVAYAVSLNNSANLAYYLGIAACPVALWCGQMEKARAWTRMLNDISERNSFAFWGSLGDVYVKATVEPADLDSLSPGSLLPSDPDKHYLVNQLELFATLRPGFASPDLLRDCTGRTQGWCLPELLRIRARSESSLLERERLLRQSIDIARRQGALSWELRAATDLAELLAAHGRITDAAEILRTATVLFTEGSETRDLFVARSLLDWISGDLN